MLSLVRSYGGKQDGKMIEKHFALVTLDRVREWKAAGSTIKIRYEFLGYSPDKKPRYNVIYLYKGKEYILVKARIGERGAEPRVLNLWPGIYNHHKEFGGEAMLCINSDDEISTSQ